MPNPKLNFITFDGGVSFERSFLADGAVFNSFFADVC